MTHGATVTPSRHVTVRARAVIVGALPRLRLARLPILGLHLNMLDLSLAITAMLAVSGAVTPMFIAILTPAIVVASIDTSSLGAVKTSGRKNQECNHGTPFGNSMQCIH
jgi:hypothetical protein